MLPKVNEKGVLFVLTKIDGMLDSERKSEAERDTRFVEQGRYCAAREEGSEGNRLDEREGVGEARAADIRASIAPLVRKARSKPRGEFARKVREVYLTKTSACG
jgi:hypothetical protein